ncbi:MAG: outer membrane beta-barrel protein [Thermodesulfobacteriota bacterium]
MKFRNIPGAALFLVFSFLFVDLATAEGNIHAGPLKIHPYISVKEEYNTNIYATVNDREDDFITSVKPGLRLELPIRRHSLLLDYNVTDINYEEHHGENSTDQYGIGALDLRLGERLGLRLMDVYNKGHEPRGSSSTGSIERFKNNTAGATVFYALMDVSKVELNYAFTNWIFVTDANAFRERDEHLVSAYFYYKFLPKTSVFIEYDNKMADFELAASPLDNTVNSGYLGLKWEISESSTGIVKGGYSWKNFDEDVIEDYNTWTASANLTHEFTSSTSVMLNAARTVNETNLNFPVLMRYFVTTGGYAELKQAILKKFYAKINGSFGQDVYSDEQIVTSGELERRKDNTTSGGAGIGYDIQDWLKLAVDYTYKVRNSNLDSVEYITNATVFTVKIEL